jgi:hypothetical protein
MMQPPPSRYKVVERGRRLEVIDTHTGKPVSHRHEPQASAPASQPQRSPAGIDDGTVFTTQRWFDDKGPRTLRLNFATRARLDKLRTGIAITVALLVALSFLFWPFVPILLFAAAVTPSTRNQLRAAATRWLDRLG